MFSSKIQLQKRTPYNGTDRENFLSLLVDEYLNTTSYDAKCQVLANLANFAYDPINYTYIRDVGVLDIFLYVVKNETDTKLVHFATAGICNLCLDHTNAEYILKHLELKILTALLRYKNKEIVANTTTALLYLYNEQTKVELESPEIKQIIEEHSKSEDKMVSNLATIYLNDIFKIN
ncbi:unnamed protein product [Chilo suppressalis]|uniref:Armadillo repeat-containing domain-containing protein n=1 Tax=Chilo suppressalis TaxID=168631 RepID=A0ABN8B8U1_CHISP|nr:hypothetical protein evm_005942 [Chilo suppressalis]CAH0406059.1 unnamed protein product [Chilo suppressalis]